MKENLPSKHSKCAVNSSHAYHSAFAAAGQGGEITMLGIIMKEKLKELGKSQVDLSMEIRKRGYPELNTPTLCDYINDRRKGDRAKAVMEVAEQVICEWESERG